MKFRKVHNTTNWNIYFNIISHNMNIFNKLKIPNKLRRGYAKLLAFYPLTEKQEKTFFNLSKNDEIGYLFNYLVKISRKNNIQRFLIKKLIQLKNEYDTLKNNKLTKIEYDDKMLIYLLSKNYNSIIDLYNYDKVIYNKYTELINLILITINSLIDDKYDNIKKYTKKYKKELDNREINAVGERRISSTGRTLRGIKESKISLQSEMDKIYNKATELEKFIENEINKRLSTIEKGSAKQYYDIPNGAATVAAVEGDNGNINADVGF